MAEGVVATLVGEEDERPEGDEAESRAAGGSDAFAAAIAAIASRLDPKVARETSQYLKHQSRLLELQAHHLEEEHRLRIPHLRNQLREESIRRLGLRLRVGFQIFLALAGTVLGIGALVALHDAFTANSVVIEALETPAALAGQGIKGTVVASGILDEITRLQDATHTSAAAKRELSSAWSNELRVEIPETGMSLGQIAQFLRARFGKDTYIGGEVVQEGADNLTLIVRGKDVPAKEFTGSARELPKLEVEAARYIFQKAQPVLWATYLTEVHRYDESLRFAKENVQGVDTADRPYLMNIWALSLLNNNGSVTEAASVLRAALALKPDLWVAHQNFQGTFVMLGDEEGSFRAAEMMRAAAGGLPGRAPGVSWVQWYSLTWDLPGSLKAMIGDSNTQRGFSSLVFATGPTIADAYARMHDAEAAEIALSTTVPDDNDPTVAAGIHFVRGELALQRGQAQEAVRELEAFGEAYKNPNVHYSYTGADCFIAPAEEAAGHPEKADAFLASSGTFVDCYRFRADILDGRGNWAAAQKAYADAVALAPDLPPAYYSWGEALVRHNQLAAAAEKFKLANQRGPHWADPLKAWGDVLVKQGHSAEALTKYTEARYAPNWAELKKAREAIVAHKG